MLDICEQWRFRSESNKLKDVYDGSMWKYFQYDTDGNPFLAIPHNFVLILNCDWFQPFKHTQFSVGVIYLAVANLPRELRFKRENILVTSIIPGPNEPSKNINSYLEPLIGDLQKLWKGVTVTIGEEKMTIRVAITCLACDIPAARKVGGFVGHNARKGCSKCLKEFIVEKFGDYPDYSGFSKSDWEPRTHGLHVWYALQQKNSKTKEEQKYFESLYGAQYSHLFTLPYYDAISMCIIDPMHCLFLGIAKHCFKVWLSEGKIDESHLSVVQSKVDSFKCPSGIGRIPYKLASKASGLKADQWKNWTMYFSLYALKGILPHADYECWLKFVKICTMICQREIDISDLEIIDNAIEVFCKRFQELYGKNRLTPNMHLLGHLTDCVRQHGPVYSFWLYAFERLNGILGSFQTSQHDITVQIMRKLLSMQSAFQISHSEFPPDNLPLIQSFIKENGSLSESGVSEVNVSFKPLPPLTEKSFVTSDICKIKSLMLSKFPNGEFEILRLHTQTTSVSVSENDKLASKQSNYSHCSKVFLGTVLYEIFKSVQCTVITNDNGSEYHKYWLACGSPYIEHRCRVWFGSPTQVWSTTLKQEISFFFIEDITNRVVFVETLFKFGNVIGEDKVLLFHFILVDSIP